mgnify:CR=1 FL=1
MSSHTPPVTLENIAAAVKDVGQRLAIIETNYVPPASPGSTASTPVDPAPQTAAEIRQARYDIEVVQDPELAKLNDEKAELRKRLAAGEGYKILKGPRSVTVVNTVATTYELCEAEIANRRANLWGATAGTKLR